MKVVPVHLMQLKEANQCRLELEKWSQIIRFLIDTIRTREASNLISPEPPRKWETNCI